MKRTFFATLAVCSLVGGLHAQDCAQYVNPFIGTGAVAQSLSGNNYPGATVPFGLVQLSPDTREAPDWAQASGYDYNDRTIFGFSHTRLSGTGASDLIDILMLPMAENRQESRFSHDKEEAVPGYYSVLLQDDSIRAELTATERTGVHRYTYYDKSKNAKIFFDLNHSANKGSWGRRIINSQIRVVSPTVIEGYRIITGWAKMRKIYFHAEFSAPIVASEMKNGDKTYKNVAVVNGTDLKAVFDFGRQDVVECKVSLSPVSIENARQNGQVEVAGKAFDDIRRNAYAQWNKELGKINIKAGETEKEIFYTALYHSMIQPNVMSDVNGEYMAADYSVQRVKSGEKHYTTFSLWDTYRAAHPLYTIVEPERTADFVNSMIRQYEYYGYLPIWQLWGQDNYCMIGNHAVPVVVDAILKGIPGIDKQKAYEAVKQSLTTSHLNSPFEVWDQYGYMPEDLQTQSVSITLEQSFDDWCAAQLAESMGKRKDYEFFAKRAANYRNLHNPDTRFFQPKNSKGEWILPFDPCKYGANGGYPFTEGNAWQYYWYVPQNVPDLIALTGGKDAFCKKLDEFFTSSETSGEKNDNASGFVGLYAHGNEPSHHVAYLYAMAGQPAKTQQLADHIKRTLYNTSSSGYAGNDDCGEMSVWYVFSALGFYPVNPASGEYILGSPTVDNAVITLPGGKAFNIAAKRKSSDAIYVESVKLNGRKLTGCVLSHKDIMAGGTLEFVMSAKPKGKTLKLN